MRKSRREERQPPSFVCKELPFYFQKQEVQSWNFSTKSGNPVLGNVEFSCHRKKCLWSQDYKQNCKAYSLGQTWKTANQEVLTVLTCTLLVKYRQADVCLGGFYRKVLTLSRNRKLTATCIGCSVWNIKPGRFNHIRLSLRTEHQMHGAGSRRAALLVGAVTSLKATAASIVPHMQMLSTCSLKLRRRVSNLPVLSTSSLLPPCPSKERQEGRRFGEMAQQFKNTGCPFAWTICFKYPVQAAHNHLLTLVP